MKFTVEQPVEIDIAAVRISIPLDYDDDGGMEKDFPLRSGQTWEATVDIRTGAIQNWPTDKQGDFEVNEKVRDGGTYILLDGDGKQVAIKRDYVPNIVPGDYGDYVELKITNGVITNWTKHPTVDDFFSEE